MSRGFGIREHSIIQDVMRFGAVEPARLRMPILPDGAPLRPIFHGLSQGFGVRLYSRQTVNRACRKLEAAGIIDRWINTRGVTYYRMEAPIARQAFRVAGEIYAAHVCKIPLIAASMDGIKLHKRKPRPADRDEQLLILCGIFAERLASRVYQYEGLATLIKAPKKRTKLAEKIVNAQRNTIARLAENLVTHSKLKPETIEQLIERPVQGE
jgi:hypothetical protein